MAKFIQQEEVTADLGMPLIDGNAERSQYRRGYFACAKDAAFALRLLKGSNKSPMPVLFLYRHYLEIALKDALEISKAFDLQQADKKFGHDLVKLWAETKPILGNFVLPHLMDVIDVAVEDFNKFDRRADAFRYAVNKDGEPQMPKDTYLIFHALIAHMDRVSDVIEHAILTIRQEEAELDRRIDEAVANDRS